MCSNTSEDKQPQNLALKILQGARASDLPIITDPPRTYLFDYRQLQRFRFAESALPPESEFLYKPLSFYEQYQSLVLSTLSVFALLILAVLTLWHLISRRRELKPYASWLLSSKAATMLSSAATFRA